MIAYGIHGLKTIIMSKHFIMTWHKARKQLEKRADLRENWTNLILLVG